MKKVIVLKEIVLRDKDDIDVHNLMIVNHRCDEAGLHSNANIILCVSMFFVYSIFPSY